MPYIGKNPVGGGFHKLDALTASATATYALTLNSAAYYPESANQLLVSLNGVIQAPQDSFTVSGSNLVFDTALTASDSIDFVVALGDVLAVKTVTDGAITTAKLGNGAVTSAKLDTNIAVSGNLDVGTIRDAAGTNTAMTIDSNGYITRAKNCAFLAHTPTAASATADTVLKWSTEVFDTDSCFNHTTGLFTAPVNGIYFFSFHSLIKDADYIVSQFSHSGMASDILMQSGAQSANKGIVGASHVFEMDANDTMGIFNYGNTYSEAYQDTYCAFSGYLISST